MSRIERHAADEAGMADQNSNGSNKNHSKKKPPMTALGKLLNFIGTLVMCLIIIMCLAVAAPKLAGMDAYVVISGSMEPAIPVGSLVYSKECDPAGLEPGEVIVFYGSGVDGSSSGGSVPVTHRVIENHVSEGEIITKGDANEQNDFNPVSYYNVLGKVVWHAPGLGRFAAMFATTLGKVAAAMIILAGYLLTEAANRMRRRE